MTLSLVAAPSARGVRRGDPGALARDITVTGEGWVGRGAQTNAAIGDQRTDYAYGTPLLRALVPIKGILGRLVAAAAAVSTGLRGIRADDAAAGTTAAAGFWQTLASNNRAAVATSRFAGAEQQLLATLPLADRTTAAATGAARAFESVARGVVAEDPASRRCSPPLRRCGTQACASTATPRACCAR